MAIASKSILVAKELEDCLLLLAQIVKDVRVGKPIEEIISGSLPLLIQAISNLDQIDDEIAANFEVALSTIGLHSGAVVAALIKKPVVQTV